MSEGLFVLFIIFLAYIVFVTINDNKKSSKSETQKAKDITPTKTIPAEATKTAVKPAVKTATVEQASKYTGQLATLSSKQEILALDSSNKPDAAADELNFVIDKLKGKDKVGVAGEALAAVGGAAGGVAAATTIASAAGASTFLGSTFLASVLGGLVVTDTPVGWVIGSAVVAGAAGYGISKLVRSGGKQDHIREQLIKKMELRLSALKKDERNELNLTELSQLLVVAIEKDLISESKAKSMISLIENGSLDPDIAIQRLKSLIENIAI
jgi:hypothetical protein